VHRSGKVLMNSAQAWTALGIFAVALGLIITLVLQLIDAKIEIVITRLDQIDRTCSLTECNRSDD
jgi:hypothetical protein